jgi:hypothetical protein
MVFHLRAGMIPEMVQPQGATPEEGRAYKKVINSYLLTVYLKLFLGSDNQTNSRVNKKLD